MTYQRRESFPAGTTEEHIVQEQRRRLADGATVSAYSGSEETGWSLIATWDLFRDHERQGPRGPGATVTPLHAARSGH
ncbi:hypothetical protein SAMN06265365_11756 [Tistlia consotensis]|uniref:Uncharacterized protein n=1 Tax=Tistlia consotensis USBA 355 TaxID=560819 RepID=A0A1Y6CEA6_9PROT|nr:hypothetical protein [Tistlia consotensis]SMF51692.1 hypothetical protein SAMN05428998_11863 [Tistlia consotensis USBA 355]SNR83862.1 hypothetical protein SAMN06265365_11756 [Tistlia consotensis]